MPTYRFCCKTCEKEWEELQGVILDRSSHISKCPICKKVCKSRVFGGSASLLKGRLMDRKLEGFPDQTHKLNQEVDKDGDQMEREYDAFIAEKLRKNK